MAKKYLKADLKEEDLDQINKKPTCVTLVIILTIKTI